MTRIIGAISSKTSDLIKLRDVISQVSGCQLPVFLLNAARLKSSPKDGA
jgi:hypothetical protein